MIAISKIIAWVGNTKRFVILAGVVLLFTLYSKVISFFLYWLDSGSHLVFSRGSWSDMSQDSLWMVLAALACIFPISVINNGELVPQTKLR